MEYGAIDLQKKESRIRILLEGCEESGAGARTRTEDLLITNQLLYQLSYAGAAGSLGAARAAPQTSNTSTATNGTAPLRWVLVAPNRLLFH